MYRKLNQNQCKYAVSSFIVEQNVINKKFHHVLQRNVLLFCEWACELLWMLAQRAHRVRSAIGNKMLYIGRYISPTGLVSQFWSNQKSIKIIWNSFKAHNFKFKSLSHVFFWTIPAMPHKKQTLERGRENLKFYWAIEKYLLIAFSFC